MLSENRVLLARRFPRVLAWVERAGLPADVRRVRAADGDTLCVDGVHLTTTRDRVREARLQAELVPKGARRAWVYGGGLADVARELLSRPRLERLDLVVLAPGVLAASLAHYDASDWLGDERLVLVPGAGERELAAPFAVEPACLRLAASACARIRDLVALELSTPFIHRHIAAREESLAARVAENAALVARDGDVAELFDAWGGQEVWVAGAGPTLADHLARLASRPAHVPLIAVDAALLPLLAAGVVPDVVVTLEHNERGLLPLFAGDLGAARASTLVYTPVAPREVLARWPGSRCAAYTAHPRYVALARSLPRATLFASGSVLHPAVDLAVRAGAAAVVLFGADFCFARAESHVAGSPHARAIAPGGPALAWVLDGRGARVPTLPNLRGYLRDLERYLARHARVAFRTASLSGARIEGAPPAPWATDASSARGWRRGA